MTRKAAYLEEFKKYIKSTAGHDRQLIEAEFYGESDRACGILQASWIELSLEQAILVVLQPRSSKLFAFPEPLSTFSAKIDFAYEVKIIGPKTRHDLDLIRELRNGFAHSMVPIRFDDAATTGICDHFQLLSTSAKFIPTHLVDRKNDYDSPRNRFLIVCYSIVKGLLDFRWNLKPSDLPCSTLP